MNAEENPTARETLTPEEREALERAWAEGKLTEQADRLMAFIERQRGEILRRAGDPGNQEAVLRIISRFITEAETIDLPSEMRDQTRAIHDEIWIRGEKGDYDRGHIAREWTSRHAAAWRRWRVKTYLFVVDRRAIDILARLSTVNGPANRTRE